MLYCCAAYRLANKFVGGKQVFASVLLGQSNTTFVPHQVTETELHMLDAIGGRLHRPNPVYFLEQFLRVSFAFRSSWFFGLSAMA